MSMQPPDAPDYSGLSDDDLRARYAHAMHGVQTGIATLMELGHDRSTTPKHLRVGVDSSLSTHLAVANLLIRKNVITPREYLEAVTEAAEIERNSYQSKVNHTLGSEHVNLG